MFNNSKKRKSSDSKILKPIRIFNLIAIDRTTDILALVAFLLSIFALGPILYGLFNFSDINTGNPRYSDAVQKE